VEDNSDNADGDMLFAASNSEHHVDSWIMDSACTFHVTSNKYWYDTYKSINSGIVTVGNGVYFKITSIGNIRIKMFDGVVRMFSNVRHVLDVKNNLISLDTLDSNGYCYKSEGEVMKVTKGTIVTMKEQRSSNSIYKLFGTTIVGGITYVESESNCTVL
jgi:hypothetical protein